MERQALPPSVFSSFVHHRSFMNFFKGKVVVVSGRCLWSLSPVVVSTKAPGYERGPYTRLTVRHRSNKDARVSVNPRTATKDMGVIMRGSHAGLTKSALVDRGSLFVSKVVWRHQRAAQQACGLGRRIEGESRSPDKRYSSWLGQHKE